MTDTTADKPRGRPRSEGRRRAILQAAGDLLLERGLDGVSVDAVAERAGVSKATIYRWWSSKELLAVDALHAEWAAAGPPRRPTATLRADLVALLRPWIRLLGKRAYARVIAGLVAAAASDPAFAEEYRARFVQPRRDQARAIFARAIERGEIPPDTDVELALDLLYGPIYHRLLHGHAPLDERFARDVVAAALHGVVRER